jgi:hypothetical protein
LITTSDLPLCKAEILRFAQDDGRGKGLLRRYSAARNDDSIKRRLKMRNIKISIRVLFILLILATMAVPAQAKKASAAYQTGFENWRAAEGDFTGWTLSGVTIDSGALAFDPDTAEAGSDPYSAGGYYGINFYNAGNFWVGEAISPELPAPFAFSEAIASWNASTPPGTWVETLIRVDVGGRWTKWYNLGIWASTYDTITRHSVRLQGDGDGYVAVDTLVLSKKSIPTSYQLKFRLFSQDVFPSPTLTNASLAFSTTPDKPKELQPGNPAYWGTSLDVPECSQMVYPDGGEVWCSPTSTSMVLSYWAGYTGPCEPSVRAAVAGVYDAIYDGHGNWPFNTAYPAVDGYEAYVVRFSSMAQVEPWVAAGVPVVVSFAWGKGDLAGAAIPSSGGHLAVLVGFDASGNPIVNDPAASADADVQRTYLRSEFESLWLEHSGGTSYLIYPASQTAPAAFP